MRAVSVEDVERRIVHRSLGLPVDDSPKILSYLYSLSRRVRCRWWREAAQLPVNDHDTFDPLG